MVGGKEIECVVFKVSTGTSDMNRRSWTEWRSMNVPGQIVKSQKPIPYTEGELEVTEVVAFEKN